MAEPGPAAPGPGKLGVDVRGGPYTPSGAR